MFIKISRNSNKSNCVGVSIWRKATRRRVINERLQHRYFPVSFTKFFITTILKNFGEWLLTNLFCENKPPCPKEIRKDNMYLSALVLLYQQIFVFPGSLVFPRDLHWPIKFQILSDQTINSPYVYSRKHWTNQLELMKLVQSVGGAVKLNLWTNGGSSESQKSVLFDSGVIW